MFIFDFEFLDYPSILDVFRHTFLSNYCGYLNITKQGLIVDYLLYFGPRLISIFEPQARSGRTSAAVRVREPGVRPTVRPVLVRARPRSSFAKTFIDPFPLPSSSDSDSDSKSELTDGRTDVSAAATPSVWNTSFLDFPEQELLCSWRKSHSVLKIRVK